MTTKHIKVGIVGGSIAGCASAIILHRLGYDVTVFEKADHPFVDRGAGITLPASLVDKLIQCNMLEKTFPAIRMNERPIFKYNKERNEETLITSIMLAAKPGAVLVNWTNLYKSLLDHLPNNVLKYGSQVTDIKSNTANEVELVVNGKAIYTFNFCLFADGFRSIGRKFLYPDLEPRFAHYIGWRGMLNKMNPDVGERLLGKMPAYLYENGSLLLYAVPNMNTDDPDNNYTINWLLYETVNPTHPLFKDNPGKERENVAQGSMPPNYLDYLHDFAKHNLPPFPRNIILETKLPYIQAIFDMDIPNYVNKRIALIGDSSFLIRPHAGSGATKALNDALELGCYLEKTNDLDAALQEWSKNQHSAAKQVYLLSQGLGELFVTKVTDLMKMNKQDIDTMWKDLFLPNKYYSK